MFDIYIYIHIICFSLSLYIYIYVCVYIYIYISNGEGRRLLAAHGETPRVVLGRGQMGSALMGSL